ncbi:MAG: nucleoside-diphosphate kinase [Gammaproteobacteria bacterium]|nr:nucleoside-diphosphate kinase [Gammaproteobacteria bacterium]
MEQSASGGGGGVGTSPPATDVAAETRGHRVERTLSIVKPDAVAKNLIGEIYSRFEKGGLAIVAAKMVRLTPDVAGGFYAEHRGKPFYGPLVDYMCSGPIVVQVLEGRNAVAVNRRLMGATDPEQAAPGTIRADFAQSIDANAVHGSDSQASAEREIDYFFSPAEICARSAPSESA